MEGIKLQSSFVERICRHLEEPLTLIDVGCSGGIDSGWRSFGTYLRALGFDPDLEECARLQAAETHPGVKHIAGFVGLPDTHPFRLKKLGQPHVSRNPWSRLSVARTIELNKERSSTSKAEFLKHWTKKQLADPDSPIVLPEFFKEHGINDIDFIKIDVDGQDYEVLISLDNCLDERRILGVGIEVNFCGSDCETDHTLHNIDRYMKSKGFELFDLSVRRYSMAALPSRYVYAIPAQTEFGRPLQGDALYLRDLAGGLYDEFASGLSVSKLLKAVCLFELFNLPDCAAEMLSRFTDRIDPVVPVHELLDRLAPAGISYAEYIRRFEQNDPRLFTPEARVKRTLYPARRVLKKIAARIGVTERFWS